MSWVALLLTGLACSCVINEANAAGGRRVTGVATHTRVLDAHGLHLLHQPAARLHNRSKSSHLQRLRGVAAPSANPVLKYGNEHDAMTKDTFVKDCAEVFNVPHEDYLPLDALEQFCQSTKAVVECRLKIVNGLAETHKQGGKMEAFCSSTYDWFQSKYGMHCLQQCHKTQCKSTCVWVAEKKELDAEKAKIEGELARSAAMKRELDKAEAAIAEAQKEVQSQANAVKLTQSQVKRAEAAVKERREAVQEVKKETAPFQAKVTRLEEVAQKKDANVSKEEAALKQLQDSIEMEQMKSSQKLNEIKRIEKNIEEGQISLKKETETVEGINVKKKQVQQEMNATAAKLQEVEKESVAQKLKVEEKQGDVKKAEEMLREAKQDSGNPMAKMAIKAHEKLVNKQQSSLTRAIDAFREIEKRRQDLQAAIENGNKSIESLERDITQTRQESVPTREKLARLAEELKKAKAEADAIAAGVAKFQEQANAKHTQIKTLEAEYRKAEQTLIDAKKASEEELAKVTKAQVALDKATAMQDLIKEELKRQQTKLAANTKAVEERAAKGAELTKTWKEKNGVMLGKLKGVEKKIADLEKLKPEVVRQHNLGLLASWQR